MNAKDAAAVRGRNNARGTPVDYSGRRARSALVFCYCDMFELSLSLSLSFPLLLGQSHASAALEEIGESLREKIFSATRPLRSGRRTR